MIALLHRVEEEEAHQLITTIGAHRAVQAAALVVELQAQEAITTIGAQQLAVRANTEPLRPRQRTSSKPSTPANDDWGAASGGDSWSSKPSTPAADDWGTGTVSSGGGRAASSASSNKTPAADDWGVSDPWGSANSSSSNNRNGGMDRSSQRSNRPPSTASAEIWDTEGPVVSAPSKDAVDDWGVATGSSSRYFFFAFNFLRPFFNVQCYCFISTRRGSRTPMEMGDATPLYDE